MEAAAMAMPVMGTAAMGTVVTGVAAWAARAPGRHERHGHRGIEGAGCPAGTQPAGASRRRRWLAATFGWVVGVADVGTW